MDIQHLVDRLEQVLNDSSRIPFSANLLVDGDKIFGIVDQMRVTVPEEIKRASRIEGEKERILAQAHEEADRIRSLAKQEASELVNREVITSSAQQRADHILERARRDAIVMRQDADVYVMEVLANLEEDLLRSLAVVRNGVHKLQADQAAAQAEEQSEEGVENKLPAAD
ncbi:MAG: ATPase [Chloroflexi bacterium]|jgi:vacuolar-type H+-ATPase subunit H|nr:ATPase [Chloroflexota bacterium]